MNFFISSMATTRGCEVLPWVVILTCFAARAGAEYPRTRPKAAMQPTIREGVRCFTMTSS